MSKTPSFSRNSGTEQKLKREKTKKSRENPLIIVLKSNSLDDQSDIPLLSRETNRKVV